MCIAGGNITFTVIIFLWFPQVYLRKHHHFTRRLSGGKNKGPGVNDPIVKDHDDRDDKEVPKTDHDKDSAGTSCIHTDNSETFGSKKDVNDSYDNDRKSNDDKTNNEDVFDDNILSPFHQLSKKGSMENENIEIEKDSKKLKISGELEVEIQKEVYDIFISISICIYWCIHTSIHSFVFT